MLQPFRKSAANTFFALVEGQLPSTILGGNEGNAHRAGSGFAMFKAVCDQT
jgi:hypothetical protein